MLRSFSPRKQAIQPFVCWRCLAESQHARRPVRSGLGLSLPSTRRSWGTISSRPLANAFARRAAAIPDSDLVPTLGFAPGPKTRDRLHEWETENRPGFTPLTLEWDDPNTKNVPNAVTRPRSTNEIEIEDEDAGDDVSHFNQADLVDVGRGRMFLLPGDLVELMFKSSRQPELAIFIREVGQHGQFYTMSGRWAHLRSNDPKFFVPGFVPASALDELIPHLPESAVSADMVDKLHMFSESLSRSIGKDLLRKMQDFWAQADSAYLSMAPMLENVYRRIADEFSPRHASLEEIADMLSGPAYSGLELSKDDSGNYPKPVLYAIHRRLMLNDVGIRVPKRGTLRAGGQYEILPRVEVKEVNQVVDLVRKYIAGRSEGAPAITLGPLNSFIVKCQHLIDSSRKKRQLTPFMTIGPLSKSEPADNYRGGLKQAQFTEIDNLFIRFIESWSAFQSFSNTSILHSIASTILRATDRYEGRILDQDLGWILLQEIGAIPPWATRAPYQLRVPHVRRRLRPNLNDVALNDFTEDRLANIRKDWGDLPVFCIDDVGAHEIDDGISIEATGVAGEHWVHIHVADPASHIHPKSGARYHAENQMQTFYLPDHVEFMINPEFVASKLSLAPGRPCLTISAKLSSRGELLDQKISAGTINNVVYITPDVLAEVTSGTSANATNYEATYSVGSSSSAIVASRPLTPKDQLSTTHKESLHILHRLGFARSKILQSRGGMFIGNQNQQISVDFNGAPLAPTTTTSRRYLGDPTIKVAKSPPVDMQHSSPVPYLMLLAGEVAANWCYIRGIPSIYRITPHNPAKASPTDFFNNVVLPSQDEKGNIPVEVASEYFSLVGPAQPSTIAGPHLAIGAEMISRCTSPLRRFPDLVVHWQIEAALQEEHRLGRSLIGNTKVDFLPFSKAKLDALLPRIDTRERNLKLIENEARKAWFAQFLVRAWHFNEAELPSPLTIAVRKIGENKKWGWGLINEFLTPIRFDLPDWPGAVQPGDLLEAEIDSINTAAGQVDVKILRRKDVLESDKKA